MSRLDFVPVGAVVWAVRDLPGISRKVRKGMRGVVVEGPTQSAPHMVPGTNSFDTEHYGPLVVFENGHRGNVYPGDVVTGEADVAPHPESKS